MYTLACACVCKETLSQCLLYGRDHHGREHHGRYHHGRDCTKGIGMIDLMSTPSRGIVSMHKTTNMPRLAFLIRLGLKTSVKAEVSTKGKRCVDSSSSHDTLTHSHFRILTSGENGPSRSMALTTFTQRALPPRRGPRTCKTMLVGQDPENFDDTIAKSPCRSLCTQLNIHEAEYTSR